MKIYTRKGDDGTTGLLHGGRVRKDSPIPDALGAVDEAQAAIGAGRALADGRLHEILTVTAADLWKVMTGIAENRERSREANDLVERTAALELMIDEATGQFDMPTEFVIPGASVLSAQLDFARSVVRRAERSTVRAGSEGAVSAYLNRLSDLLWALARWVEQDTTLAKDVQR